MCSTRDTGKIPPLLFSILILESPISFVLCLPYVHYAFIIPTHLRTFLLDCKFSITFTLCNFFTLRVFVAFLVVELNNNYDEKYI